MSKLKAITRLNNDLLELKNHPIVGANMAPFGDNLFVMYGLVIGLEGTPYANIPIRFTLEFSDDYPNKAPNAYFDTLIKYTAGGTYYQNGRLAICLSLFGNLSNVHTEWKNSSEGWSPAYTLTTILISMQGLMMSDMLSNNLTDIKSTIDSALTFKCNITGHDGSNSNKYFPQVITTIEELRLNTVVNKYDIYKDFYICSINKTSVEEACLGYGIHIENARIGMLSSPCEYISEKAFNDGTRRSSTNKSFEYWFPILTTKLETVINFDKMLMPYVNKISKSIKIAHEPSHFKVLKICSSVMNTLVVEIMGNRNNLTANDKFINGYFTFYRIMKEYSLVDNKIVKYVDNKIKNFISDAKFRTKEHTNNLGELLIFLTISSYTWNDISQYYLEENDTRNVFWYCVGNYNSIAPHPELLNVTNKDESRSDKVFKATETSRNLVMFQVKFCSSARNLSLETMKKNNNLAPEELRLELKDTHTKITQIDSWNKFFDWLSVSNKSNDERNNELIDAVSRSKAQGYHKK